MEVRQYFEEQIVDGGSDRCVDGGFVLVADRVCGAARHGQVSVRDHPLQPAEGGHPRGPVGVCGQIRWLLAMAQVDGQGSVTFPDQVRPIGCFSDTSCSSDCVATLTDGAGNLKRS